MRLLAIPVAAVMLLAFIQSAIAQSAPQSRAMGARAPQIISPEVSADRRITFRLVAPKTESARVAVVDFPSVGKGEMTKNAGGTWEITIGPVPAGAYRYVFNVDGITVVDPRNYATSEGDNNVQSVAVVPGSDVIDVRDVPHGAVAAVTYHSNALNSMRRMHIYTPPGYENGTESYPVLYLLHGGLDSDETWMGFGRANFILDNLIAQKKAVPMIVVTPAGLPNHGQPAPGVHDADPFGDDFLGDIVPYVESHYRTINDRGHRAITGLSTGGGQSLGIAFSHLKDFGYVGDFSSGTIGANWEQTRLADLDNAELKPGLKLLWIRIGSEDGGLPRTKAAVELLKKHGFTPDFQVTEGGHLWTTWRDHLQQFVQLLFR